MRVSTWSCGTGSSGGTSSFIGDALQHPAVRGGAGRAAAEVGVRVSNRIMPPKRRKSLILRHRGVGGRRLALGDRPVEERVERDVVGLDVDRHRIGRLDRGAVEERPAQALEAGRADRVDPRVAGQHVGEHGLVRGVQRLGVGRGRPAPRPRPAAERQAGERGAPPPAAARRAAQAAAQPAGDDQRRQHVDREEHQRQRDQPGPEPDLRRPVERLDRHAVRQRRQRREPVAGAHHVERHAAGRRRRRCRAGSRATAAPRPAARRARRRRGSAAPARRSRRAPAAASRPCRPASRARRRGRRRSGSAARASARRGPRAAGSTSRRWR